MQREPDGEQAHPTSRALRRMALFSGLDDAHLDEICPLLKRREIDPPEAFVLRAESDIYFIWRGQVDIYLASPECDFILIRSLREGENFGEASAFGAGTGGPYTAVFEQPVTLLILLHHQFKELLNKIPRLRAATLGSVATGAIAAADRISLLL